MIMKIDTVEKLKEYITKRTQKLRDEIKVKKEKPSHPLITAVEEVWPDLDFGCQQDSAKLLVEMIVRSVTGDKSYELPDEEEVQYKTLTLVVPQEKKSEHNYPVGEPFLVNSMSDGYAHGGITVLGKTGNHHHGIWRYATDEEMVDYFSQVPEKALLALL